MVRYFCTGYIDFMLKSKIFLDFTKSFYPREYEKNDEIVLKYFQQIKAFFINRL